MPTNFPTAIDVLINPAGTDPMSAHAAQHASANDAIEAIQAKVGVTGSTDTESLEFRVTALKGETTALDGRLDTVESVASAAMPSADHEAAHEVMGVVTAQTNPITGGISLSAGSQVLTGTPVMTFAELKTALTAGFVGTAFVSDVGGGTIWVSDGTKAKPIGGTIDIYQSTTSSAFTTSVTRNVGSAVAIPAGLIGAGDTLEVGVFSSKSGATDTGNIQVNLGDSAGAVGVQLGGTIASLNYIAATRRYFGIFRFRVDSNTSLTLLNGATGQDGSTSTSAISACVSTVSDLSSAVRYLQISNAMGAGSGDIITIEKLLIRLSK